MFKGARAFGGAYQAGRFLGKANKTSDLTLEARRDYLNEKFKRTGDLHVDISYKGYSEIIEKLNVSTDINKAYFYSGNNGINRANAMFFARMNGGKTIDMTQGGKWLMQEKVYQRLSDSTGDKLWQGLSTRYAQEAKGDVRIFAYNANPSRVLYSTEIPLLRSNPNVTGIIYEREPTLLNPRHHDYIQFRSK